MTYGTMLLHTNLTSSRQKQGLTVQLIQSGQILNAVMSVVGSVGLSLLMVWFGLHIGVGFISSKGTGSGGD